MSLPLPLEPLLVLLRELDGLLTALEKPLTAEFLDDVKLVSARDDNAEGNSPLRQSIARDREAVRKAHESLTRCYTTWEHAVQAEGLAQTIDDVSRLLHSLQSMALDYSLLEQRLRLTQQRLGEFESIPTKNLLPVALGALQEWQSSAKRFSNDLRVLSDQIRSERVVGSVGLVSASRYVDERLIGEGRECNAFLATDTVTNTSVVLRKFHNYLPSSSDADIEYGKDLFLKHIAQAMKVNIVGVQQVIGFYFVRAGAQISPIAVAQYIPGKTLAQVRAGEVWTPDQVLDFMSEVGPVLQKLLGEHIAHGDLSPDNIIVSDNNSPRYVLIDTHKILVNRGSKSMLSQLFAPADRMMDEFDEDPLSVRETWPFYCLSRIALYLMMPFDQYKALARDNISNDFHLETYLPV